MTEFQIVDKEIADIATKSGMKRRINNDSSLIVLRELKPGKAIQVPLPERSLLRCEISMERARVRGHWSRRARKVSKEEGKIRAFKVVTSDDSKWLFIQRVK